MVVCGRRMVSVVAVLTIGRAEITVVTEMVVLELNVLGVQL